MKYGFDEDKSMVELPNWKVETFSKGSSETYLDYGKRIYQRLISLADAGALILRVTFGYALYEFELSEKTDNPATVRRLYLHRTYIGVYDSSPSNFKRHEYEYSFNDNGTYEYIRHREFALNLAVGATEATCSAISEADKTPQTPTAAVYYWINP